MVATHNEKKSLGNPGFTPMGQEAVRLSPESASDPGPKNPIASSQATSSELPPSTDRGDVQNFWFPFARAHKRIQEGGWARQVTVKDLPISTTISGVNMRLLAGAIRELHWHTANEWALMLYGNARITCFDQNGRMYIKDVKEGDLWFFPSGFPHSIQGLGPDGCEFLLVFDDGHFSEDETFLISEFMSHTDPTILAKNFGVSQSALQNIPENELYIFKSTEPRPLQDDISYANTSAVPHPFTYSLYDQKPDVTTKGGEVRIVDSSRFQAATTIAAALVTIHPGGMREMHWHPNADEWLYIISGQGSLTTYAAVGRARTMDFNAGDVGYVPKTMGHFLVNTGDTDIRYLEMFRSSYFADVSLTNWMAHTPLELLEAHTHISRDILEKLPKNKVVIQPL
jgi:oxalate decarboxylase